MKRYSTQPTPRRASMRWERHGVVLFPRIGLGDEEPLIAKLTAHATRPEIVYRHEWQVGDLVMWDNCGVMHRAPPDASHDAVWRRKDRGQPGAG